MAFVFLILLVLKMTCVRKLGLLISLVTASATFESISLLFAIWKVFYTESINRTMTEEELSALQITPICIFGVNLVLNVSVTRYYQLAIQ